MPEADRDTGALSGIRVLEVGEGFALACAGGFFAGYGADVVKVEPPGRGDRLRMAGPFPGGRPDRENGALFAYLNGGKRGVTLDHASPTGRALLRKLVRAHDIVLHSLEPGEAELVFDDGAGSTIVSVTAFGASGPYASLPGTELTMQAMMGLAYITGEPHREPLQVGVPLASYVAGQTAFVAALASYFGSAPRPADVSMFESGVAVLEHAPVTWTYRRRIWKRRGNWSGIAGWGVYPCADGYVAVISGIGAAYGRFRDLVGLADPKFASASARTRHASEMDAAILAWLERRTRREAFEEGQRRRLPFGYVAGPDDVLASPQLHQRGFLVGVQTGTGAGFLAPGAPCRMSETGWRCGPPPRLGEHNIDVYGSVGLTPRDLTTLRQRGVV